MSAISSMRDAAVPTTKSSSRPSEPKRAAPPDSIASLYRQIDSAGTGSITRSQFQQAFANTAPPAAIKAIGVEAAFKKLDPQGTGVVTRQDFIKGMSSLMAAAPKEAPAVNKPAVVNNASATEAKPVTSSATAPNPPASPVPSVAVGMTPAANGSMIGGNINIKA
jgi:hypothetical protein